MKFIAWIMTDRVGSKMEREFEIDDQDLDGLEGIERDSFISEYAHDELMQYVEWGWREADKDDR